MIYKVIGYESYDGYRKIYFEVDASSKEDALQLAKDGRADEMDSKDYGGDNYKNANIKDWIVEEN